MPDGSNGRMKDDFCGIIRCAFITETMIKVNGGREVWNILRWQVSTEAEIIPTSISINPRDCKDPSLYRESEFIAPPVVAHVPWVEYRAAMFKLHIYTVGPAPWNGDDKHGYRCNGWIHPDR